MNEPLGLELDLDSKLLVIKSLLNNLHRRKKMPDVHTSHCCIVHGCKYQDSDCTVTTGTEPQQYDCEYCTDDRKDTMYFATKLYGNLTRLDQRKPLSGVDKRLYNTLFEYILSK